MPKINNIPTYAKEYKWIVARLEDSEYWFWGAWNDEKKALEIADKLENAAVYENMDYKGDN